MDWQRREIMIALSLAAVGGLPVMKALRDAPLAGDRDKPTAFAPAFEPRVRAVANWAMVHSAQFGAQTPGAIPYLGRTFTGWNLPA